LQLPLAARHVHQKRCSLWPAPCPFPCASACPEAPYASCCAATWPLCWTIDRHPQL